MAQPIKYNTGTKTAGCCIRLKTNFDIGVVQNYQYGPTLNTDFWAGYNVPTGGFLSFQNKGSQGPSIYAIPDFNSLVSYGNNMNIGTITAPEQVIVSQLANPGLAIVNIDYPELPYIDNNVFTIDAGYTPSYPWGSNGWIDITQSSAQKAVLTGDTTFISGSSLINYTDSVINFSSGGQNAWAAAPPFGAALTQFTINVWVRPETSAVFGDSVNIVGQRYKDAAGNPYTDCNFLIRGNGSNSFQGLMRINSVDFTVNDTSTLTPGAMYNFTLTFDGNELKLYKDGGQIGASGAIGATPISNGQNTIIGGTISATQNTGSPSNYFNGSIGLVNIYDIALNTVEVQALYDLYKPRY